MENRPSSPSPSTYVVKSGRNGNTWWRKYSDGLIEQYVVITPASGETPKVTFPIAFSDMSYLSCASARAYSSTSNPAWSLGFYGVEPESNTRAVLREIHHPYGIKKTISVYAIGY